MLPRYIVLWLSGSAMIAALVVFLCSALVLWRGLDLATSGVSTTGHVSDFFSNRSCRSAEVVFETPDGQPHSFHSTCPTSLEKGESVKVVYIPSRLSHAAIDSVREIWGDFVLFILVGIALVTGAMIGFSRARHRI